MPHINLFRPDLAAGTSEHLDTLLQQGNVTIERIISPPATTTEILVQPQAEWICILQGSARLQMDEQVYLLHRGDQLLIPANSPHRVLSTSRSPHCLWLAVHIH